MNPAKFLKGEIPHRAGLVSSTKYVLGFNPRRHRTQAMAGTNPKKPPGEPPGDVDAVRRRSGGLSSKSAPYKHQMGMFGGNIGVGGPGEDLPP